MEVILLFCAVVLIYVASIFAVYRVICKHQKKHHIRHIVMLIGVSFSAWYLADYFKNLIMFPRPDLAQALFLPQNIHSYGFPSGHAAFMFALASTMYSFDKKAGRILYVFASLTGIARVLAGVHFWYDIVGGAILGVFVSFVVVHVCKRFIKHY